MTKSELLKLIVPGDEVYFEFKAQRKAGWYEYEGLSTCESDCGNNACPGSTKFKGINSQCLVYTRQYQMLVSDIRKKNILPDELFQIEI